MIGNDIVDLEFANYNSRWQEQRFLDKLFSTEEQDFILSDGKRFENIWRLWSMKESVYKIICRADGIIRFNPKDFKCVTRNRIHGHVAFDDTLVSTVTQTNKDFIQTTAFLESNWISEVFQLGHADTEMQRHQTYQHAITAYAQLKMVPQNTVEIIKNEIGIPKFYIKGRLLKEQLSLTHHGHFGAWAIAV